MVAQRQRLLEALSARPGERVLDVGSGPGFLAADLAERGARVEGVDLSEDMVRTAGERFPSLRFRTGEATSLPFDNSSFDAVTCTQVLEYVADVGAALAEFRRVLEPGGRVAIIDTDWDSVIWSGADRELTERVLKAWDAHLVDPHLPVRLKPELEAAGFERVRVEVIPILNLSYEDENYSRGMSSTVERFVAARGALSAEEAAAWRSQLAGSGDRYFFSLNRYLFTASAPSRPAPAAPAPGPGR